MGRRDGFDIVIVGAGAAGCVITHRLSEPGDRSVLLRGGTGSPTRDAGRLSGWLAFSDVFDPVLLRPHSRGSVRLRSADPAALPRISLPGVRESADLDRLADGYRRGLELANRPEIRRLSREPAPPVPADVAALRRTVAGNAYSIPHVVGTCATGPSRIGARLSTLSGVSMALRVSRSSTRRSSRILRPASRTSSRS